MYLRWAKRPMIGTETIASAPGGTASNAWWRAAALSPGTIPTVALTVNAVGSSWTASAHPATRDATPMTAASTVAGQFRHLVAIHTTSHADPKVTNGTTTTFWKRTPMKTDASCSPDCRPGRPGACRTPTA